MVGVGRLRHDHLWLAGTPLTLLGRLLEDDHGGSVTGGVDSVGVNAGEDEEDKVDGPEEPGEDGAGNDEAISTRGLAVVAVIVSRTGRWVVVIRAVSVVPVVVVRDLPRQCGLDAADHGGREPDDEAEGDVSAGVDARV